MCVGASHCYSLCDVLCVVPGVMVPGVVVPICGSLPLRSLLCSQNVWEDVQTRLRSLLTSPKAMDRLANVSYTHTHTHTHTPYLPIKTGRNWLT